MNVRKSSLFVSIVILEKDLKDKVEKYLKKIFKHLSSRYTDFEIIVIEESCTRKNRDL